MTSPAQSRTLDAAFDLYVTGGIDAVSMRELAGRIGITAPALYKHFAHKDALIEAIAERGFLLFEKRLRLRPATRPLGRIAAVLEAYRDFALNEPHLFEIMFAAPRARLRRYPADFAAGRSGTFNLLRAAVDEGMAQRRLKKDDALEVTLDLWAYAHGLIGLYRAGRFGTEAAAFRRLFDRAIKRLLAGLSAPKGGKRAAR